MSAPQELQDPALLRMEQAAQWLQRMRVAGQDERVIEDWLNWCQRDPLNQQAYDEIAAIWELTGWLDEAPAATGASPVRSRGRRGLLAASVAGLGVALAAGYWWTARPQPDDALLTRIESPIGAYTNRTLADGSLLELGGGTQVSVSIGARERRIELHEGELYVTVHKDPRRPLWVNAGRLQVLATGTEFNVQRSAGRTVVTLAEGSIDALYDGQAEGTPNVQLQPGQQLVYTHATRRVQIRETDARDASAWRSGTLRFRNEPLSEVIETLNRYAARRIVIEDADVGALSFTGTARTDSIAAWLRGLPIIFPVAVVELPDGRQLVAPRPGANPG